MEENIDTNTVKEKPQFYTKEYWDKFLKWTKQNL